MDNEDANDTVQGEAYSEDISQEESLHDKQEMNPSEEQEMINDDY